MQALREKAGLWSKNFYSFVSLLFYFGPGGVNSLLVLTQASQAVSPFSCLL
jgi:hypothetical protein